MISNYFIIIYLHYNKLNKSDIYHTVSGHLFFFNQIDGIQNRLNAIINLYDYLMTIPKFLIANNNFKLKAIEKLFEIKKDSILNDKNDDQINNRNFILNKFEIYENYLTNLDNYGKIIIKI